MSVMSSATNFQVDTDKSEDGDFLDYFVISTSTVAFLIWKAVVITISFISSFHYVQIAAFFSDSDLKDPSLVFYQVFFCVELFVNFFTEAHSSQKTEPERSQRKIALIYLKGRFLLDILAIIPFNMIAERALKLSKQSSNLFLLIKVVRIIVGFKLLHY